MHTTFILPVKTHIEQTMLSTCFFC